MTVKFSISLPDEDVAYLDTLDAPSRSVAVHQAIVRARQESLESDYTEAFAEWSGSDGATAWESHNSDGIE
ncbi:MAG: antitoxin [Actinomycetes bacterium]